MRARDRRSCTAANGLSQHPHGFNWLPDCVAKLHNAIGVSLFRTRRYLEAARQGNSMKILCLQRSNRDELEARNSSIVVRTPVHEKCAATLPFEIGQWSFFCFRH